MNTHNQTDNDSGSNGTPLTNTAMASIPTATVSSNSATVSDIFRGSYMWLVALACLVVAIGVAWWSMPQQGIHISIHFPEGHGLKAEDSVRFRGIDVGVVEEVKLNRELSGVDVDVNLFPFAEPLAREGTRFWIVRPELSLAGISGLDTAVGHKYIGLIPGDQNDDWRDSFDGLNSSPPDAVENLGVEIILRGESRRSVGAGSPVTCRGVVIGRVLSVGLSQDGRFVDTRAKIFEKFTKLVTSKSRFWPTSGVDVEVSLTSGMKLNTESLETLLRGGVSMLTIENGGQSVKPGQVYALDAKAGDDWLEEAGLVQATDIKLRGALPMDIVWKQKGLLGTSEKNSGFVAAHLESNGESYILVPNDVLVGPKKAIAGSLQIGIAGHQKTRRTIDDAQGETFTKVPVNSLIAEGANLASPFTTEEMRSATQPERCLAVRAVSKERNGSDQSALTYFHYPIEPAEIGEGWNLTHFNGDRSVWHGAPVLSAKDGKLIGILIVGDRETLVIPIPKSM